MISKDLFESDIRTLYMSLKNKGLRGRIARTDPGGENVGKSLEEYLHNEGILHCITPAATPELNGKAERPHRTVKNMTTAAMLDSNLPKQYWEFAHNYMTYTKNFVPHSAFSSEKDVRLTIPAIRFNPSVKFPEFHTFGSLCYFHNNVKPSFKFSPRGIRCLFLGFADSSCTEFLLLRLDTYRLFSTVHVAFPRNTIFLSAEELKSLPIRLEYGRANRKSLDEPLTQSASYYPFDFTSSSTANSTAVAAAVEISNNNNTISVAPVSENGLSEPPQVPDPKYNSPVKTPSGSGETPWPRNHPKVVNIPNDNIDMPSLTHNYDSDDDDDPQTPVALNVSSFPEGIIRNMSDGTMNLSPASIEFNEDPNDRVSFVSFTSVAKYDIENKVHHSNDQYKPCSFFATNNTTYKNYIEKQYKTMTDHLSGNTFKRLIPRTYEEALSCADSDLWVEAINKELEGLTGNGTWKLIHPDDVPSGRRPLKGKWVFDIKHDGRYKARFVVKGFLQQYLRDYTETFAPVINSVALKVLLAKAAQNKWKVHQFDVPNAFLKGTLKEDIYMFQPKGNKVSPEERDYICKLIKSLYGLKQASREFYLFFSEFLIEYGFKIIPSDECIFMLTDSDGDGVIMCGLHVDDGSVMGSDETKVEKFLQLLRSKFNVTTNPVKRLLGMDITQTDDNSKITISMSSYIKEFLEESKMSDCNPVRTPMEIISRTLSNLEDSDIKDFRSNNNFRTIVGSVSYLCNIGRPDISVAVNYLSRNQINPSTLHWKIAKRLLRYLKGTIELGISYSSSDGPSANILYGFADADWASDTSSRNSTSGYIFKIGDNLISWKCKLQDVIALSTTEAEYYSLSAAVKEAKYLRALLSDLGFNQAFATTIFEDNQGCVNLAHHSTSHERTKHIDIKHHFIRQEIRNGAIKVIYCPTRDMVADIMTKPLSFDLHSRCISGMGLVPIHNNVVVPSMGG